MTWCAQIVAKTPRTEPENHGSDATAMMVTVLRGSADNSLGDGVRAPMPCAKPAVGRVGYDLDTTGSVTATQGVLKLRTVHMMCWSTPTRMRSPDQSH